MPNHAAPFATGRVKEVGSLVQENFVDLITGGRATATMAHGSGGLSFARTRGAGPYGNRRARACTHKLVVRSQRRRSASKDGPSRKPGRSLPCGSNSRAYPGNPG